LSSLNGNRMVLCPNTVMYSYFLILGQYLTVQITSLQINTYSFARQSIINKGIKQWQ